MKLLKLYSNKASFRTLIFNNKGLSLIIGENKTKDEKKTYNSLGKSLSIALIHYCLGSDAIRDFTIKLSGWEFYLDFEIEGQTYTTCRKVDCQNIIFMNGKEMKLEAFRNSMNSLVFNISNKINYLSFRTLISRFARPRKDSYNSYDYVYQKETDYTREINNAFLLGLDIEKVQNKSNLFENLKSVKKNKKNIENDELLRGFFQENYNNTDISIQIVNLKKEKEELQEKIKKFCVAEDYHDIQENADRISLNIKEIKNLIFRYDIAINNIDKSLKKKIDITKEQIINLYTQAEIELPDIIKKRLSDVESFNERLYKNRLEGLTQEKNSFISKKELKLKELQSLEAEENRLLEYLGSHGALNDYTQLNEYLNNLALKLEKLIQYDNLLKEYQINIDRIKQELSIQNIQSNEYLAKNNNKIENIISIFQSLTYQFYSNKDSGITIKNNEKENSIRFDINAKISEDTGDGVNEVKIFCFDWTILKLKHHNVDFIAHDSRLVSDIDPRQVATMLRIAFKECFENGYQYILNINEATLNEVKSSLTEEEIQKIIEESTILELSDYSDASRLLGIKIELNYL